MSDVLLDARSVVAGYQPGLPIIHGVSVNVAAGEVVTIIGPNGAGKSTFIKAIAGLVRTTDGAITLADQSIVGLRAHEVVQAGVGFVPQTANVFTTLTIQENLLLGSVLLRKRRARQRIEEIYNLYPVLREKRADKAGVLSGGQRQILAVARALLTTPKLLLLDEPTAGLSPRAAMQMFDVIADLVRDGVAVLMVEQNARAALRVSDRGYVLAEGLNRVDGPADRLLNDPEISEIFLGGRQAEKI
jgi:branched-chain amino acid transport system ATP-binding protein